MTDDVGCQRAVPVIMAQCDHKSCHQDNLNTWNTMHFVCTMPYPLCTIHYVTEIIWILGTQCFIHRTHVCHWWRWLNSIESRQRVDEIFWAFDKYWKPGIRFTEIQLWNENVVIGFTLTGTWAVIQMRFIQESEWEYKGCHFELLAAFIRILHDLIHCASLIWFARGGRIYLNCLFDNLFKTKQWLFQHNINPK